MEKVGYEASYPDPDAVFSALADPTRRAILARLSVGTATVGEIAEPFRISQSAISRHLKVLESAGLIKRAALPQTRPARLNAQPLAAAVAWLEEFHMHFSGNPDQPDRPPGELIKEQ